MIIPIIIYKISCEVLLVVAKEYENKLLPIETVPQMMY